jgi:hypothetical protein
MSQENLTALKRLYERLAAGDLQAGADLFDRYFVFISDPGDPEGQVHYGLDAFTAYMRRFREVWGDMRFRRRTTARQKTCSLCGYVAPRLAGKEACR